jgi:hypothetical protein
MHFHNIALSDPLDSTRSRIGAACDSRRQILEDPRASHLFCRTWGERVVQTIGREGTSRRVPGVLKVSISTAIRWTKRPATTGYVSVRAKDLGTWSRYGYRARASEWDGVLS